MKKTIFAILLLLFLVSCSQKSYPNFVQCLSDKEVTFYGAFWCPHCQNQKKLFGDSAENLPYIECSTEDGKSQTEFCKQAEIKSYPTWEFSDGTRKTGEVTLEFLASKTGCVVDQ